MSLVRAAWACLAAAQLALAGGSVFPYRVRGDVRLVLFWVGKDEVGGGKISVLRGADPDGRGWWEEIEVLFGTEPERLPVKVNRWGYGRERAEWKPAAAGSAPRMMRTVFEGFMRHSGEQSVSEVLANGDSGGRLYDAIHSEVRPAEALSELRTFAEAEEFRYREPERMITKYARTIAPLPPDRRTQIANAPARYDAPFGFLSAVSDLVRRIAEAFEAGGPRWNETKPSAAYVYNAKVYRLEVRKIEYAKSFRPSPPGGPEVPDVATASFQATGPDGSDAAEFTIAFPLGGGLRGVPLRIVYKPRWWLRLRLDFDFARHPYPLSAQRPRAVGPPWEPSDQ